MLPTSVHILARLQRCNQTRRLLEFKLERQINRAITLRQAGKLAAATEIEKEIAAYLQHQKALGRTTDQALAALNRALQKDLTNNNKTEVNVTITVKGGTRPQKAQIADQTAGTVQKAIKAKITPLLAMVPTRTAAAVIPTTALLMFLVIGGLSSQAASIAARFHCSKTWDPKAALTQYHQKMAFPVPIIIYKR